MSFFPAALENLIDKFAMLPGIGKKSAQRLAFFTLSLPDAEAEAFAAAQLERGFRTLDFYKSLQPPDFPAR